MALESENSILRVRIPNPPQQQTGLRPAVERQSRSLPATKGCPITPDFAPIK